MMRLALSMLGPGAWLAQDRRCRREGLLAVGRRAGAVSAEKGTVQ